MEFFNGLKKRYTRSLVLFLLRNVLFILCFGIFVYFGFYLKAESESLLNLFWLCAGILIAGLFVYNTVSIVKNLLSNKVFNSLMDKVSEIGNAEYIGSMLESIPQSNRTKRGELRFNSDILFYRNNTVMSIIEMRNIREITTRKDRLTRYQLPHYYVVISGGGTKIEIDTKKELAGVLKNEITEACNAASDK